jgi:hypothetical protein
VQARAVGDDLDVLVLVAVLFDDMGGVVQHHVHHLRVVLDRDAVSLAVGGKRGGGEGDRRRKWRSRSDEKWSNSLMLRHGERREVIQTVGWQ